jgi:hypothetical protein
MVDKVTVKAKKRGALVKMKVKSDAGNEKYYFLRLDDGTYVPRDPKMPLGWKHLYADTELEVDTTKTAKVK